MHLVILVAQVANTRHHPFSALTTPILYINSFISNSMAKRTFSKTESEPELTVDLDSKKKVSVRQFNGINLVDIREFYQDKSTNILKPGAKGIALNEKTWIKLLECQDEISAALARLSGADPDLKKRKEEEETTDSTRTTGDTEKK